MTKVKAKAKPKAKSTAKPKVKPKGRAATKASAKPKAASKSTSRITAKTAVKPGTRTAKKSAKTNEAGKTLKKAQQTTKIKPVVNIEKAAAPVVAAEVAPARMERPRIQNRITEKGKARETAMIRAKKEALETAVQTVTKGKKRGRKARLDDLDPVDGLSKLGKKWASLYRRSEENKTPAYTMRGTYEEKTPIQHKVLGRGYILSNKNDRLEVLFKDGIKFLISNYKA